VNLNAVVLSWRPRATISLAWKRRLRSIIRQTRWRQPPDPEPPCFPVNPKVSIVIPTCNRQTLLRRCLDSVRRGVDVPCETIVVDGRSADGTREWLASRNDVLVVLEPAAEGITKAVNRGFRLARSPYVMWLNDDAELVPGSVEAALELIERPDLSDVGLVGFYHTMRQERNRLDEVFLDGQCFGFFNVRGYPYANFGLLRRDLLERIGYADEGYVSFGWDPDLSLKVQLQAGLKVVGCRRALIRHAEHPDERRAFDVEHHLTRSNERLFAKWNLPGKFSYPDPRPAYQQFLRERKLIDDTEASVRPAPLERTGHTARRA
jgi:GT2 family glycosyltransferase